MVGALARIRRLHRTCGLQKSQPYQSKLTRFQSIATYKSIEEYFEIVGSALFYRRAP